MRKRNLPQNKQPRKIKRERDPIPRRYFLITLMCGLILVVGFFFAARQHFSSIDYGIKNSRLRKQLDELEAEKRRLMLAREIAMTPSEIKKAAKKLGLIEVVTNDAELISAVPAAPKIERAPEAKPKQLSSTTKSEQRKSIAKSDEKTPPKNVKPDKKLPETKNKKDEIK